VEWSLLVLKDEAGQKVQLRDVGMGRPAGRLPAPTGGAA